MRSPTAGYPTSYSPFVGHRPSGAYDCHAAPGLSTPPPVILPIYDSIPSMPPLRRSSVPVDRTVPSRPGYASTSYARGPSSSVYSSPEEPPTEPTIKEKQRRYDAEQLKTLNEAYARTAFPSTKQVISLENELGVPAIDVQIW